jgi:hypothetical protein
MTNSLPMVSSGNSHPCFPGFTKHGASTGQYYWEDVFILGVPKTSKSNSLAASSLLVVLPQSSTIHVSIHLPMARLLSGQPGSGKSFVARQLVAELQLGDGADGGYKPRSPCSDDSYKSIRGMSHFQTLSDLSVLQ